MAHVSLSQLIKTYADASGQLVTAVKGIDLEINDGEFMVLVGPSGCGKSTTLRMVAGLESVTSGAIRIGERVVNDVPPKERDIAMVFQNYALYPHMTVYENLAFGLRLRKLPKAEIEARVREAATLLGLDTLLARKPKALSGGQRQRVAVGRAIVRKPKVFLFDEPLSNLDAKMRVSMRNEIARLHARLKSTVIYVTHDQVEAMTMGDRICVMRDGHILQVAPPLELYNRPANLFVAGFIGSPPMNFFRGTVERTGDQFVFVQASAAPPALRCELRGELGTIARAHPGKPVVLGIRPEDIDRAPAEPLAGAYTHELGATVDLAEPMGAETYLHLKTGTAAFVARVRPLEEYKPGQQIRVSLHLTKAHLFDAETEQRIGG